MGKMKNKFVVYTALFGDYDDLIDPKENYEGCDFICFTDQKDLKSDVWEIRIVENIDLPLNMVNRRYKILPHLFLSEYEKSLYLDTNIAIIDNPLDLASKYLSKYDVAVPKHLLRDCAYEEAKIIIQTRKSNQLIVENQMNSYKEKKFPTKYGLSENNIIFRNHNKKDVILAMEQWWKELNEWSQRDQLSFCYIVWSNDIRFVFITENSRTINSKYFFARSHKNDSFISKFKNYIKYKINRINNK